MVKLGMTVYFKHHACTCKISELPTFRVVAIAKRSIAYNGFRLDAGWVLLRSTRDKELYAAHPQWLSVLPFGD